MKPWRATIPIACLALSACETPWTVETVRIVNATTQQVIVTAGDDVEVIYAGKSAEFPYPHPGGWSGGEISIETHTCRFAYQLPHQTEEYPWRGASAGLLALQMESDFKLYAIPAGATRPQRFTDFSKLQYPDDFPVAPEEQDCNRV